MYLWYICIWNKHFIINYYYGNILWLELDGWKLVV